MTFNKIKVQKLKVRFIPFYVSVYESTPHREVTAHGRGASFKIFRWGYGMLKLIQISLLMRMREKWVESVLGEECNCSNSNLDRSSSL
jgi:hypothetical protein